MNRILIIDDEISVCTLLTRFLAKHHYVAKSCISGTQALKMIKEEPYDIILCDYHLQDINGKELFEKIKPQFPDLLFIFITAYADIRMAVDLMKSGAYHYLSKPLYPAEILEIIRDAEKGDRGVALKVADNGKHIPPDTAVVPQPYQENDAFSSYVVGHNKEARQLYQHMHLVASTDYNVIIYGETGTGKESIANLIHQNSPRREGPFLAIDCGSLPLELAGSELFGHEKGAFTGALTSRDGAFQQAEGGTLFLDEIGNLSYEIQVYLLRALQEKVVRRIGSMKNTPVNVRIIVATNENLLDCVSGKRFREDLYHRLNEFALTVPALRNRRDDFDLFVQSFLDQSCKELNKKIGGISERVKELFTAYHWPGNIRELKNVIRRACLLTSAGKWINPKVLPLELQEPQFFFREQPDTDLNPNQDQEKAPNLKHAAVASEQKMIIEVLQKVSYNKTKAAAILNIDRKTLYNKLRTMQTK